MKRPGMAGVSWRGRGPGALPGPTVANAYGNLPGITGYPDARTQGAPGPYTGGQLGGTGDGSSGADPRAAKRQPSVPSTWTASWSEGQAGNPSGPPLSPFPYGGIGSFQGRGLDHGWGEQTGTYGNPEIPDRFQSFRRNGTLGFNDKLTVKDRHAYWDTGNQKTGTDRWSSGGPPNSRNNPLDEPPRPDLRLINRTVSYQLGTDHTINQDDLTRAYSWLGEQGSGWSPVYGGVPGLYQPYGSRGGVPFAIQSPVPFGQPGDGPRLVFAGPPHGLHSQTPWKGGAQYIRRVRSTPQTRPVRQDRPSNSPQAGQSYSQTVLPQGASPVRPAARQAWGSSTWNYTTGRGWAGQMKITDSGQNWLQGRGSAW